MPTEIIRQHSVPSQDVTFTSSDSTTGGFNLAVYAGGMIHVTSGSATLTWKVKELAGFPTVFTVADSSDTAVTQTVQAGRAYALPDQLYGASYVLATTDSGTITCRVIVKG
jgi:hypothetical protein